MSSRGPGSGLAAGVCARADGAAASSNAASAPPAPRWPAGFVFFTFSSSLGVRLLPGPHLAARLVEEPLVVPLPHLPARLRRQLREERRVHVVDLQVLRL